MKTTTKFTCLPFAALALACFGALSTAQAVTPPPDGGYTGWNTAEGSGALFNLTTGAYNTAIGGHALYENTTGSSNTAAGAFSLATNRSGNQNVAVGQGALRYNTTGPDNTAIGSFALNSNIVGGENTAIGFGALQNSRTYGNAATGSQALHNNTTGYYNTATGLNALYSNTSGSYNTAIGALALAGNRGGSLNTVLGAHGGASVTTAHHVICIGAGLPGSNVNNTTWIDNIYGVATQGGTAVPVMVSYHGQLATIASSERFKKDIATMDKASEAIMSLRPVTFHYKTDTKGTPQFGLVAEEVAKVNPALVLPDKEGKPYTVRYDAVNAMLLNEFLKEHRTVQELKSNAAKQESIIAQQQKQIEALTAGLQRVNAQLQLNKLAPQIVNTD
jgi:hypothetical protein